ncbi:MAG: glycosyltransferase family 4 protein [Deltaproteobacteria bacterium]|nr:glycosyltransferase family 4 protein [Deltaproteobacteria bacterium]
MGYNFDVIVAARELVRSGTSVTTLNEYDSLCDEIAVSLVATFERENVGLLVVENGTLPDNPIFTEALYRAIRTYGARRQFGKFVLWRDHDMMWSAEPHLYGVYPYAGVRRPDLNPHIHYAVLTEWMRTRMVAWSPGIVYHVISNRFFFPDIPQRTTRSIRESCGIPANAYLFARCTRVIPQKSIERDLRLIDAVQRRIEARGINKKVFLFVTGPKDEDPREFARLCEVEQTLSIAGQVIWGDGCLLPFNLSAISLPDEDPRFTIRDLVADADISSFLTTYDYEGFGNPPGEAMCMGTPFIATTYELYHEVYGSKGAIAPLWWITATSSPSDPVPEDFVDWTFRVLEDAAYREQIIQKNLAVCQRYFSMEALHNQLMEIFPLTKSTNYDAAARPMETQQHQER